MPLLIEFYIVVGVYRGSQTVIYCFYMSVLTEHLLLTQNTLGSCLRIAPLSVWHEHASCSVSG